MDKCCLARGIAPGGWVVTLDIRREVAMPVRSAHAEWEGNLKDGKGRMKLSSGAFEGNYSFQSRFEEGSGTNPEELIGAAHAGCFSMALAHALSQAGYVPAKIETGAKVRLERVGEGFKITSIDLETVGRVPGIEARIFVEQAEQAKKNCPVSQALAGVEIRLQARLA
jgi:osmotically inducible protein OsmC